MFEVRRRGFDLGFYYINVKHVYKMETIINIIRRKEIYKHFLIYIQFGTENKNSDFPEFSMIE